MNFVTIATHSLTMLALVGLMSTLLVWYSWRYAKQRATKRATLARLQRIAGK